MWELRYDLHGRCAVRVAGGEVMARHVEAVPSAPWMIEARCGTARGWLLATAVPDDPEREAVRLEAEVTRRTALARERQALALAALDADLIERLTHRLRTDVMTLGAVAEGALEGVFADEAEEVMAELRRTSQEAQRRLTVAREVMTVLAGETARAGADRRDAARRARGRRTRRRRGGRRRGSVDADPRRGLGRVRAAARRRRRGSRRSRSRPTSGGGGRDAPPTAWARRVGPRRRGGGRAHGRRGRGPRDGLGARAARGGALMELRRLRLLLELSRRGTLAAVADTLAYSPSSISVQLAELEREVGVKLLRRVGRNVQLTPAGWRLAEYAEQALAADEAILTELAGLGGTPRGQVRVTFVQTSALALLPHALGTLAEQAPDLRIEVFQRETRPALDELRSRAVDLVLGIDYDPAPVARHRDVDRVDLIRERVLMAVPAQDPLAASGGRDLPRERGTRRLGRGPPGHRPRRGGRDAVQRHRRATRRTSATAPTTR